MARSIDTRGADRKRSTERPTTRATLVNARGEITPHELHGTRRLKDDSVELLFECKESGAIRRWGRIWPTESADGEVLVSAVEKAERLYPGYLFPGVRLSREERVLMAIEGLRQLGAATSHAIALYMGRADSSAESVLRTLRARGHVGRSGKVYRLTPAGERWYAENARRLVDEAEDDDANDEVAA